jgi:hypothetical protein
MKWLTLLYPKDGPRTPNHQVELLTLLDLVNSDLAVQVG